MSMMTRFRLPSAYQLAAPPARLVRPETTAARRSAFGRSLIADRTANLGTLAYEMTLFATRAGGALSPRLIAELKNAVQQ